MKPEGLLACLLESATEPVQAWMGEVVVGYLDSAVNVQSYVSASTTDVIFRTIAVSHLLLVKCLLIDWPKVDTSKKALNKLVRPLLIG